MNEPILEQHTCKSCGHVFSGIYCNQCGEKVLQVSDRKFKSFLGTIVVALTFADSKFIQTLWLIIKKPGFISKEYVNGVRVKYVRPLQLFFILNLIYFLFPVFQLFNSSLFTQMYLSPHRGIAREMVIRQLSKTGMSHGAYTMLYDTKSQSLAKLLIVIFIVLAAIPLSLIFRKKKLYFTDHSALSVELACYNLAINALLLSTLFWGINYFLTISGSGWTKFLDDRMISFIFILTNAYFLWRAGRTFYEEKKGILIVKVVLGMAGLYAALEAYRILLFLVTFWSV